MEVPPKNSSRRSPQPWLELVAKAKDLSFSSGNPSHSSSSIAGEAGESSASGVQNHESSSPKSRVRFGWSDSLRKVVGFFLLTGFLFGASLGSPSTTSSLPLSSPHALFSDGLTTRNLRQVQHSTKISSPTHDMSHANVFSVETSSKANHNIERKLSSDAKDCPEEDGGWVSTVPKALQFTLIAILIFFSAFFSGLTLSLMGLDTIGLEIVMSGDDPALSRAASKIYPVRKNGNLLLCTLLLGNVAVNTLLGILMAEITGGTVGFVTSTVLIVIFGEIIPQALFSRYALQVGEKAVPVVKGVIILFYIMAKPLAFCLDKLLGHELGTTYSKAEMSKLLEIHVKEGRFNQETGTVMTGALKYQDMAVKDVMTPLENTFMINVDEKLNFDTMSTIFKTGYSRIPVYESSLSNVIGLLFVKDLIFIDPEDETPVRNFVNIFGRGAHVVWPDDKLGDVLRYLKKGHTHMALVRDVNNNDETQDPFYELKGIITLEDIIEIILGEEIVDETDAWVDGEHSMKVNRATDFDWARLRLLDAKIVDQNLSEDEVRAVSAHLRTNYTSSVTSLSDKQLLRMISATPVTELPEAEKEIGELMPADLLYEKGAPSDMCTLILNGRVTVVAGNDNFRSDVSSWSILGAGALTDALYSPDFSAYVSSGPCRCLRFSREIFTAAADASSLERVPSTGGPETTSLASSSQAEGDPIETSSSAKSASILGSSTHVSVQSENGVGTGKDVREHRGKLLETFLKKNVKGSKGEEDVCISKTD